MIMKYFVFIFIFFAYEVFAQAKKSPMTKEEFVAEVLFKSNVEKEFSSLGKQLYERDYIENKAKFPTARLQEIEKAYKVFLDANYLSEVRAAVQNGLTAEELILVLAYFADPLVLKIQDSASKNDDELYARTNPEAFLSDYLKANQDKGKGSREKSIKLLIHDITKEVSQIVIEDRLTNYRRISIEQLEVPVEKRINVFKTIETQEAEIFTKVSNELMQKYTYLYKNVSTEDLAKYVTISSGKEIKKFRLIIFESFKKTNSQLNKIFFSNLKNKSEEIKKE